jgi:hypothetical protein
VSLNPRLKTGVCACLSITIIGIPLVVVGAMVFDVLVWVGSVYGRIAVGMWLSYPPVNGRDSAWIPVLAETSAGQSHSPFTFTIPLFTRTPKGALSPPPGWLRRRYRKPIFFAAV